MPGEGGNEGKIVCSGASSHTTQRSGMGRGQASGREGHSEQFSGGWDAPGFYRGGEGYFPGFERAAPSSPLLAAALLPPSRGRRGGG